MCDNCRASSTPQQDVKSYFKARQFIKKGKIIEAQFQTNKEYPSYILIEMESGDLVSYTLAGYGPKGKHY